MYVSFTHPYYLASLFAIPVLIFFHFFSVKTLTGRSLKFANFKAIARVKGIDLYSKNIGILIFNIFFIILLACALSGMTLHKQMDVSSFSFVVAIDSSQSMNADDLYPNRFSVAKETANDFVSSLPPSSKIGLISFAGSSVIEEEVTDNKQILRDAISTINMKGFGGTDIAEAVTISINLLKGEESGAIILLSDGQINTGDLYNAIDYAKRNNVMIHTIGIGTVEGGEFEYGMSKLDEETLKALSYNTEGRYFSVQSKEDLKESFYEISNVTEKLGSINLAPYLILIAIILFIIKEFLSSINKIRW